MPRQAPTPPMPEGFTDLTAWMAIHWEFSHQPNGGLSTLDRLVIDWQKDNQARVLAAIEAQAKETS